MKKAKEAEGKLTNAPEPPPPTLTLSYDPAVQAPRGWGDYEIPPKPIQGKNWAAAEEAMARGDYDGARDLYDKALDNNEIPEDLVDIFEQRVDEAEAARRLPPSPDAAAVTAKLTSPISKADADTLLLDNWDKRVELPADSQGAMSRVSQMPGHPDYIIKEITPRPEKGLVAGMVQYLGESEVVAARRPRSWASPRAWPSGSSATPPARCRRSGC